MNINTDDAIKLFQESLSKSVNKIQRQHADLLSILYLEEDYDKPDAVLQAADAQNQLYTYYASLFHYANEKLGRIETAYKIWRSEIDVKIQESIFNANIKKGMTANNAKPTAANISNYYNKNIAKTEEAKTWEKRLSKVSERVSQLRIMRDSIDKRAQSIQIISTLLGKCIDRGIIEPEIGTSKRFKKRIKKGEKL